MSQPHGRLFACFCLPSSTSDEQEVGAFEYEMLSFMLIASPASGPLLLGPASAFEIQEYGVGSVFDTRGTACAMRLHEALIAWGVKEMDVSPTIPSRGGRPGGGQSKILPLPPVRRRCFGENV